MFYGLIKDAAVRTVTLCISIAFLSLISLSMYKNNKKHKFINAENIKGKAMKTVDVVLTSTKGIMHLVENAEGREKSVDRSLLKEAIDPEGPHMLYASEELSQNKLRTQWYVKIKDSDAPEPIWLDIDTPKLSEVGTTVQVDVPDDLPEPPARSGPRSFDEVPD